MPGKFQFSREVCSQIPQNLDLLQMAFLSSKICQMVSMNDLYLYPDIQTLHEQCKIIIIFLILYK